MQDRNKCAVSLLLCVCIQQVLAHSLIPNVKYGSLLHPELSDDQVVLAPSVDQCDLNQPIKVSYQRVDNDRDQSEKSDFVGLFRVADPTTLAPFDVAVVGETAQTGEVSLRCRRAGDMEIRIVRLPGVIIGRVPLKVFGPCSPSDCSGHGKCNKGQCECQPGWEGEGCGLLSGEGVTIGWLNNPNGEFYFGDELVAKISHSATDPKSSGTDIIGVFSDKHPTQPIQSVFIPLGQTEVVVPLPDEAGNYFLKFTRGADGKELASSNQFGLFNHCPNSCSLHGKCSRGACICDTNYDRSDCSRGPDSATLTINDEAYIGQVVNVKFSRDESVPGLFTDQDWIGVYHATDDSTDNPEYYAYAIAEHIYDPDVLAKKTSNFTAGSVQLVMPAEPGAYVVKYVRQDHAKYAVTPTFTVFSPCANNCSSRAPCQQGICVCPARWTGDDCSLGMADFSLTVIGAEDLYAGDSVTVNFTRPVGNNTNFDFIGLYGVASANNSDLLYGYAYAIASSNDADSPSVSGLVQLQLMTSGNMTLRYVNAYTLETETEIASPLAVYSECANNCSEQGICKRGLCQCAKEWKGEDCSMGAGIIEISPVTPIPVLRSTDIGFQVHYKRPLNHFTAGDFVALFPENGPFDVDSNLCYAYTTAKDEADVFLLINSNLRNPETKSDAKYVLKYFSGAHEDLGSSDSFAFKFEN